MQQGATERCQIGRGAGALLRRPGESAMSKLKVYKYKILDPITGYDKIADRMGIKEYIQLVNGTAIEETELEVDSSKVDPAGKTELGFNG
jgi:hypothetical protein